MKTAISIPDDVFRKAERLAKRLRKSRSQLYTEAVRSYVTNRDGDAITAKLNEVYAKGGDELDPSFVRSQHKALREKW